MQRPIEQSLGIIGKVSNRSKLIPTVIFITSVTITLLGIFALSAWAETAGLHHAVQHVLIFMGGAGVGSSFIFGLKTRKEKKCLI